MGGDSRVFPVPVLIRCRDQDSLLILTGGCIIIAVGRLNIWVSLHEGLRFVLYDMPDLQE